MVLEKAVVDRTMQATGWRHVVWAVPLAFLLLALSLHPPEIPVMASSPDSNNPPRGADESQRVAKIEAIGRWEMSQIRVVAPLLVDAAGDDSEMVREAAVGVLEEMGPPEVESLDDLTVRLRHTKADVGYWSATLLGRLGPEAKSATTRLAAALNDSPHAIVRQRAAWALGKIGPDAADTTVTDALRRAAASDDPRLARLADRALRQLGG